MALVILALMILALMILAPMILAPMILAPAMASRASIPGTPRAPLRNLDLPGTEHKKTNNQDSSSGISFPLLAFVQPHRLASFLPAGLLCWHPRHTQRTTTRRAR